MDTPLIVAIVALVVGLVALSLFIYQQLHPKKVQAGGDTKVHAVIHDDHENVVKNDSSVTVNNTKLKDGAIFGDRLMSAGNTIALVDGETHQVELRTITSDGAVITDPVTGSDLILRHPVIPTIAVKESVVRSAFINADAYLHLVGGTGGKYNIDYSTGVVDANVTTTYHEALLGTLQVFGEDGDGFKLQDFLYLFTRPFTTVFDEGVNVYIGEAADAPTGANVMAPIKLDVIMPNLRFEEVLNTTDGTRQSLRVIHRNNGVLSKNFYVLRGQTMKNWPIETPVTVSGNSTTTDADMTQINEAMWSLSNNPVRLADALFYFDSSNIIFNDTYPNGAISDLTLTAPTVDTVSYKGTVKYTPHLRCILVSGETSLDE